MFDKMNLDSDIDSDVDECETAQHVDNFGHDSDSESIKSIELTDSEEEIDDEEVDVKEDDDTDVGDISEICEFESEIIKDELTETTYETSLADDNAGWITTDNFDEMKTNNFGLQAWCVADFDWRKFNI